MDFASLDELTEELESRGYNFLLLSADPKKPNEPDNLSIRWSQPTEPFEGLNNIHTIPCEVWQLFSLMRAFCHFYEELTNQGGPAITGLPRVDRRISQVYNLCDSLYDNSGPPFIEGVPEED